MEGNWGFNGDVMHFNLEITRYDEHQISRVQQQWFYPQINVISHESTQNCFWMTAKLVIVCLWC